MAAPHGVTLPVVSAVVPDALTALASGDAEEHDALIARAAEALTDCEIILLGQFSMARAAARVRATTGKAVLTTPGAAVDAMRRLVQASQSASGRGDLPGDGSADE